MRFMRWVSVRVSQVHPIKNRLRMYRKMAGLTQVQVAGLMELVSSSQLSRWERGERMPTLKHSLQLAGLYNRLVTDLFFDVFDEERSKLVIKQTSKTKNK